MGTGFDVVQPGFKEIHVSLKIVSGKAGPQGLRPGVVIEEGTGDSGDVSEEAKEEKKERPPERLHSSI